MATPKEKLKRLRLDLKNPFPEAYKTAEERKAGTYGKGKQGPLTEGLRAKSERQKAKETPASTKAAEEKEVDKPASSSSSGKSFSQAFREARAEGKDTFTWNGKKYSTEMASDKKAKKEESEMFTSSQPDVEDTEEGRTTTFKKGGMVRSSASKRADGCCVKGKTRGRMI
jgi:hypothetical protein